MHLLIPHLLKFMLEAKSSTEFLCQFAWPILHAHLDDFGANLLCGLLGGKS